MTRSPCLRAGIAASLFFANATLSSQQLELTIANTCSPPPLPTAYGRALATSPGVGGATLLAIGGVEHAQVVSLAAPGGGAVTATTVFDMCGAIPFLGAPIVLIERFGAAIAFVGDMSVPADGVSEIAVGAPDSLLVATGVTGLVSILDGATGGVLYHVTPPVGFGASGFGQAVVALGADVALGDGVADYLVGDRLGGVVTIVPGGPAAPVLGPAPTLTAVGELAALQALPAFAGMSALGDYGIALDVVFGVGPTGFVVGVPRALDSGGAALQAPDGGLAMVYSVSPAGVVTLVAVLEGLGSFGADARFGQSVAGIGDVDGDGVGDIAVGAPDADQPVFDGPAPAFPDLGSDIGAIAVYSGAAMLAWDFTTPIAPLWVAYGDQVDDEFGTHVSSVPDMDGDGVPDVAARSFDTDDSSATERGYARVLSGATGEHIMTVTEQSNGSNSHRSMIGLVVGGTSMLANGDSKISSNVTVHSALSSAFQSFPAEFDSTTGGTQQHFIDLGPSFAFANYIIVGSVTPPLPTPIPINWRGFSLDLFLLPGAYFNSTFTAPPLGDPLFFNTVGVLDATGRANAYIRFPSTVMAGQQAWHTVFAATSPITSAFLGGVSDITSFSAQ